MFAELTELGANPDAAFLGSLIRSETTALLSDEERLAEDSVARLVDREVAPIIAECFATERFPIELVPRLAERWPGLRLAGPAPMRAFTGVWGPDVLPVTWSD